MKRFIEGNDRTQSTLLPECLDDYIGADNPIRAVDAFVEYLDLTELGFSGVVPAATGRPSYHPAVLLKLYIYGYLNRVQSSRRLEREAQRNVELMWLTGKLAPDFKTIADFRRDNGPAIRKVCREFVVLCRRLNLFSQAIVAIDGSKFRAVNSRDRNFTPTKIDKRLVQIEESIARYLSAMDTADRHPSDVTEAKTARLKGKVEALRQQMQELQAMRERLVHEPDHQVSLTDPDARAIATSGRCTGVVGYNLQAAVDAEHHLIVAHELTNVGSDREQLAPMARQAQHAAGQEKLTVVADRGYYKSKQILACEEDRITPFVPKPHTSNAKAEGRFDKADFTYEPATDTYRCPAGSTLIWRFAREEGGLMMRRYWSSECPRCVIKAQCTPSAHRRVSRWEHENVLDAMQARLDRQPEMMRVRRQTIEHVFGTLKFWMGAVHFTMKRLKHVQTEMSLHVLAYNFKRVIRIVGMENLMAAIRA
jgi:transposase